MMTGVDTDHLLGVAELIGVPRSRSVAGAGGRNGIVARVCCPIQTARPPRNQRSNMTTMDGCPLSN
jgi:hypothetical protein